MPDFATISLWELMQTLPLKDLVDDQTFVASLYMATRAQPSYGFLDKKNLGIAKDRVARFEQNLRGLELLVSAHHAAEVLSALKEAKYEAETKNYVLSGSSLARLVDGARQLGSCTGIELQSRLVFFVPPRTSAYMDPNMRVFGDVVDRQFPVLAFEAQEAARCFGLGRFTASAFHAIRSLEAGIRAVSRCLGIPDPTKGHERNWSNVQRTIRTAIDEKWREPSEKLSAEYRFFDKLHASLLAFQNPYRNDTMHLEARYDEEEARHILEMVRGFLTLVAGRCNQDGLPLA